MSLHLNLESTELCHTALQARFYEAATQPLTENRKNHSEPVTCTIDVPDKIWKKLFIKSTARLSKGEVNIIVDTS